MPFSVWKDFTRSSINVHFNAPIFQANFYKQYKSVVGSSCVFTTHPSIIQ